MKLKSTWTKYETSEKIIAILFLSGLTFLITGIIMLLSIRISVIFSGFNLIYNIGVINSLKYYEPNNLANIIFLKIGIIFTIFLMPITSGISIIWFIIKRGFF